MVRIGKRFYFLLAVVAVVVLSMAYYHLSIHGPVAVEIDTDDDALYDDFVLIYGSAIYQMEGSKVTDKRFEFVSNRAVVEIDTRIHHFFPSYFFVAVCHPLYRCGIKHLQFRDARYVLDFGEVDLYSWETEIRRDQYKGLKSRFLFEHMLVEVENNYLPYIRERNIKLNVDLYARKYQELCEMAFKSSPEELEESCGLSRFQQLFSGVKPPAS